MKERIEELSVRYSTMLDLLNLADMLRELDLEKNDTEIIRETLGFIADKIEESVSDINGKNK